MFFCMHPEAFWYNPLKEDYIMNEFISKDSSIVVNVDHAEAYIPADSFSEEDKQSSIAPA